MAAGVRAFAITAVSGLAVGLHWATPALAVALSFIAMVMAVFGVISLNTVHARLAYSVTCVGYFATVYLGSGSLWLGLSALSSLIVLLRFYETGARLTGDYADLASGVALVTGLALLALAWPVGMWGWAVAPMLLGTIMMTVFGIRLRRQTASDYTLFRAKLKEGMDAPDFSLPILAPDSDTEGTFTLSERRGGWVLLFFLRGTWCPVCQMVARSYQRQHESLARRGVQLCVVSPSGGTETEAFARSLGLTYTIVHDEGHSVGTAYNAMQSHQDKRNDPVLPVAILVDPEGVIRHISKPDDPRIAADPAVLDRLIAEAAAAA